MIRLFTVGIIAISACGTSAAPVPKEMKSEAKFGGTWSLDTVDVYGKKLTYQDQYWAIDTENRLSVHSVRTPPQEPSPYVHLIVDSVARSVDYKYINGNNTVFPGIYEIQGDALTICCNIAATGKRPAKLEAGPDVQIWRLTRLKPETKK